MKTLYFQIYILSISGYEETEVKLNILKVKLLLFLLIGYNTAG